MPWSAVIEAPFGRLGVRTDSEHVREIRFLDRSEALRAPTSPVAVETVRQLEQYFLDADFRFSVPIELTGTPFQVRVWERIARIPKGQTITYTTLAEDIGSVARAVGGACGRNPVPVIVPCHRVVAVSGIGGFNGAADDSLLSLPIKRWLLAHEL
ncbi:methylated-DNA--[protein]-cysteine S-methyltransferase [Paludibacterium paludis]|uniref:Methylated-DNA--protein-cysteine methyltransferase n=1 Tax=Paludibacterium paludis TaxID=1225769 RepID=A0A918UBY2_9NEIS|nr:methylated-DNA--[protein]-cysteine S-methyltransferase [Paludibacterium paludis]GGY25981.1 methylated-DNA--protein-cysteine methyltransferase [Paludibacterium paludis]